MDTEIINQNFLTNPNATPIQRFAARWLDRLFAIVGGIIFGGVSWPFLDFSAIFLGILFCIGYLFLKDAFVFLNGQGLGKKIVGIRVVDRNTGQSITNKYSKSVLREIPQWIPLLNIVDALIIFDNGYRIGDNMANTRVVQLT
jgi:uncharacterized RDD family membrane protein YckC